jgi:hypothetical protein
MNWLALPLGVAEPPEQFALRVDVSRCDAGRASISATPLT